MVRPPVPPDGCYKTASFGLEWVPDGCYKTASFGLEWGWGVG